MLDPELSRSEVCASLHHAVRESAAQNVKQKTKSDTYARLWASHRDPSAPERRSKATLLSMPSGGEADERIPNSGPSMRQQEPQTQRGLPTWVGNTQRSYSVCRHQSHRIFPPTLADRWKQSAPMFTSATAKNNQARQGHGWPIVLTSSSQKRGEA